MKRRTILFYFRLGKLRLGKLRLNYPGVVSVVKVLVDDIAFGIMRIIIFYDMHSIVSNIDLIMID